MTGHLFVIRGDLNVLACSAVLVPCDSEWDVVWDHWSELLSEDEFELGSPYGARLRTRLDSGLFADVSPAGERRVRLVVTADDARPSDECVAVDGVVEAISDFRQDLGNVGGRVKPLVALPLVGTGAGGFNRRRGALINLLLPALRDVARESDVDVALVLRDERDYAAVQSQRTPEGDWTEFEKGALDEADRLGRMAATQQLSLFLGAGVSKPLGLPDWAELVAMVGGKEAQHLEGAALTREAERLRKQMGDAEFDAAVQAAVATTGCAPSHYLLGALRVRQNVTTNYDTAYERALDVSWPDAGYRVLTRNLAEQPHPWVLKVHGDLEHPSSIVLTESDYQELEGEHRALIAVIESLLLTSHLLFVGYSLRDPDFANAVARVRHVRELALDEGRPPLATVLALDAESVEKHDDLPVVPMGEVGQDQAAARRLEIFLDRVAWAAATHDHRAFQFLLDDDYADLVEAKADEARLKQVLQGLLGPGISADDPARRSGAWAAVERLLRDLGSRP